LLLPGLGCKEDVNVEELIRRPFIELLDRIATYRGEGNQAGQQAFFRRRSDRLRKLSESTATVTVSAANPMIALSPGNSQVKAFET